MLLLLPIFKVGETPHWGGGVASKSKGGGLYYYTSQPGSSKYGDAAFGAELSESENREGARLNLNRHKNNAFVYNEIILSISY